MKKARPWMSVSSVANKPLPHTSRATDIEAATMGHTIIEANKAKTNWYEVRASMPSSVEFPLIRPNAT